MPEKFNHFEQRKGADEAGLSEVRILLKEYENAGKIKWEETDREFVISFEDRKRVLHVPKWGKIPLEEGREFSGGSEEKIKHIVEALLENPEAGEKGKILETIHEIENRKKNSQ